MFKKYQFYFTVILCLIILITGIIQINKNLYKLVCRDNDKEMVAEAVNADNAQLKIFENIGEDDKLYSLLDNSKNKSIMIFFKVTPFDLRIEDSKYYFYLNEAVIDTYKSSIDNIYASTKYECFSVINHVRNDIFKIVSKMRSY